MKVSIVIPVYNAEKHLHQCVNSILSQNFADFELVIIDDGSIDKSGQIAHEFATIDHRVHVYSQVNSGVSAARNRGIDIAKGTWIAFIDADDFIAQDYFEVLRYENTADLIIQDIVYVTNGCNTYKAAYKDGIMVPEEFLSVYGVYPYYSSSWGKFFKASLLKRNNINFDVCLSFGEDTLFNLQYIVYCKIIRVTSSSSYKYRVSGVGLTNTAYNVAHDLRLYKKIKAQLIQFKGRIFYNNCLKVPVARVSRALYNDLKIEAGERQQILNELVENNFRIILQIYTEPKIRVFFLFARLTGYYGMLDFVLERIYKKSN